MCGIAGIFDKRSALREGQMASLARMSSHMQRRGPDADGLWTSKNNNVALAHRRLAIIDPAAHSDQPMRSRCGRYAITFNGEIYNFAELRRELQAAGHDFTTRSDTEVVLAAFAQWATTCFDRFRGMFAIAIWDEFEQSLTLARDPLGIKPLYVCDSPTEVRFASQVKALVESGAGRDASNAGLVGFLMLGSFPEPFTPYSDIVSLRAGEIRTITTASSSSEFSKQWRESWADSGEFNHNDKAVHQAVRDSVSAHLVSDVPVGLFLSSGIDSCAIASLARDYTGSAMKAVTLRFDDYRDSPEDEGPLARKLCEELGLEFHESYLTDDDLDQSLPDIIEDMDQPSIDGFNTWFISRAAAQQDVKVVLSGVGGDELFGGYPSFGRIPSWLNRAGQINQVPGAGALVAPLVAAAIRYGLINPKAALLLTPELNVETCWLAQRSLFRSDEVETLIGHDRFQAGLIELNIEAMLEQALTPKPAAMELQISALESSFYLRNQLLRDADWASMAHSLELRTPLVDSTLYSSVGRHLPGRSSNNNNKDLLASAPVKALPDYITRRPKTGFVVPMERWLDKFDVLDGWKRSRPAQTASWHWARKLAVSVVDPKCLATGGVS